MTLACGLVAIVVILMFVAWLARREHLPMRRTLKQIRELPEHIGDRIHK